MKELRNSSCVVRQPNLRFSALDVDLGAQHRKYERLIRRRLGANAQASLEGKRKGHWKKVNLSMEQASSRLSSRFRCKGDFVESVLESNSMG